MDYRMIYYEVTIAYEGKYKDSPKEEILGIFQKWLKQNRWDHSISIKEGRHGFNVTGWVYENISPDDFRYKLRQFMNQNNFKFDGKVEEIGEVSEGVYAKKYEKILVW